MLSNEEKLLEECDKQKSRSYVFMIPILERYAVNKDTTQAQTVYVANTELTDRKCRSEARNNRFQLRTN
jgi:hypothetical protein